ncbi:Outer membrane protein OmpA [Saccharicrinis carchari]|uniref:Outer membrane protein OmpA n=1 Tax=Saccharicrinis carchari TaxID=1168039 RepID=A0A521E9A6_SACCC|nr:OmpA family protein [Saccharicrinis carchari]SMO80342.1 Outer membrane protein OmpA [Saccharicrinis carchari]
MQTRTIINLIIIAMLCATNSFGQVKVDAKKKINHEANQRANQRTEQAVDKGFDKLEEGIGSLFKKKKKKKRNEAPEEQFGQNNNASQPTNADTEKQVTPAQPKVEWAKFDFVPGDEVIFEDGPSSDEENGEFPSRWDLADGNIEIASVNNENVIYYLTGGGIVPYMKNSKEDYLPEIFTLECDMYFTPGESARYWIKLRDAKNQRHIGDDIKVYVNGIECGNSEMRYPGTEDNNWAYNEIGGWKHISVAFTKGKLKAYMDDTRLINIPRYEGNPTGITISAERFSNSKYQPFLKNVRIAKGGVKYYDRVLSDGKIIVNGIRFDVNKATIKPESNGAINKIFELMQKQSDLNFSVEGHTDSDGDDALNQTLSEKRAKAVMDRLISMGISSNRLKSAGWGESKPIGENGTAEGKANNRRVEFVKF